MKRFVVGFFMGAAVGASIIVLVTPRSATEMLKSIQASLSTAIEAGQEAAKTHEKELWDEFHQKLQEKADEKSADTPQNSFKAKMH